MIVLDAEVAANNGTEPKSATVPPLPAPVVVLAYETLVGVELETIYVPLYPVGVTPETVITLLGAKVYEPVKVRVATEPEPEAAVMLLEPVVKVARAGLPRASTARIVYVLADTYVQLY